MKIIKASEISPNEMRHNELLEKEKELDEVNNRINELKKYLESPKFYADPTVQVKDVLTWLGRF